MLDSKAGSKKAGLPEWTEIDRMQRMIMCFKELVREILSF